MIFPVEKEQMVMRPSVERKVTTSAWNTTILPSSFQINDDCVICIDGDGEHPI